MVHYENTLNLGVGVEKPTMERRLGNSQTDIDYQSYLVVQN